MPFFSTFYQKTKTLATDIAKWSQQGNAFTFLNVLISKESLQTCLPMDQLLIIVQISLLIFSIFFVLKPTQKITEKKTKAKEKKSVVGFKSRNYLTLINRGYQE